MTRFVHYYGRFATARGQFGSLPSWARCIVGLLAVPGVILLGLSLLAVVVSILALLLLTVPVYRVLAAVTMGRVFPTENPAEREMVPGEVVSVSSGRRPIDVKIIDVKTVE